MPYDLLWPVCTRLDAGIPEAKVVEEVGGAQKNRSSMSIFCSSRTSTDKFYSVSSPILTDDTLESLQSYAKSLLATLPDAKGKSRDCAADAMNGKCKASEESWRIERDRELADEGGLTGCREAVELLTRNQRKGEKLKPFFFFLIV
jgi:RAB6A-GEF complex partner protein 2